SPAQAGTITRISPAPFPPCEAMRPVSDENASVCDRNGPGKGFPQGGDFALTGRPGNWRVYSPETPGPTMTIENIQEFATGTVVICTWFDKDNKYFSRTFSPEVIETPPKPGLGVKN
ncbi:DUF2158 domain-containing protein, partial [Salmonella enterica]|nr:DUF2158 domain-containing protein [Salmonella enterica]